jgi:hypothetical protein
MLAGQALLPRWLQWGSAFLANLTTQKMRNGKLGMRVHVCNPSPLGGLGRKIASSKPAGTT